MKKYSYENGYTGKIEYWSTRLIDASRSGDTTAIEKAQASLNYFVGRQLNHHGAPKLVAKPLYSVVMDQETLSQKVEWTYNFKEGGWNQEWATSLEEAFHQAVSAHPSLTPDRDSFRRASEEEVRGLLSLFY